MYLNTVNIDAHTVVSLITANKCWFWTSEKRTTSLQRM